MSELTKLPNIGKTLSEKLNAIGINSEEDLKKKGSKQAIIELASIENSGVCINMLYALEGAIQGIRWHNLEDEDKQMLKEHYRMVERDI